MIGNNLVVANSFVTILCELLYRVIQTIFFTCKRHAYGNRSFRLAAQDPASFLWGTILFYSSIFVYCVNQLTTNAERHLSRNGLKNLRHAFCSMKNGLMITLLYCSNTTEAIT
jgi:hypothetical protein